MCHRYIERNVIVMPANNTEERMQILRMIEEGKVTSDEGLQLLDALENKKTGTEKVKWLRVKVKSQGDKTKANINIPVSLVDVGLKIGMGFVPELKNSGLNEMDIQEILQAIKNGAEGKIVEVEDEENNTTVEVYVE